MIERFFFVHVMKTGGATFRRHIEHNFPEPGAFYPDQKLDAGALEQMHVPRLLNLPERRHARIRAYMGHFPFVTAHMLDPDILTLTILRNPVERTISYLKQCKRNHAERRHLALEEIYDDPYLFHSFIKNHQIKVFAITPDDQVDSLFDIIEIDDAREKIARANLERVDVIGLQERYDEFLEEMKNRFGWHIDHIPSWRVSKEDWEASPEFRERIAQDNAQDIEFYQFAKALVAQRGNR